MKRTLKIVLAVAGISLLASFAFAHGRHGHHGGPEMMPGHITQKVDEALDAAKATPAQRNAIHASLEQVFDSFAQGHKAGGQAVQEAIAIFEADKIDPAVVARHRADKEAQLKKIGDTVVQFLHDAHDTLTAAQRQQVVAFVHSVKAEHGHDKGFKERVMGAVIQARIDDVLEQIKATTEQRAAVNAAKDRVIAAFQTTHADLGADHEQILSLFLADKIDNAKVDALRADHMSRMKKVADAVVQSITEVHDALSAEQRTAIIGYVKAHHPHHRG